MSAFLNYFSHKRNICIVKLNIYLPLVLYAWTRAYLYAKVPAFAIRLDIGGPYDTNERNPLRALPLMV